MLEIIWIYKYKAVTLYYHVMYAFFFLYGLLCNGAVLLLRQLIYIPLLLYLSLFWVQSDVCLRQGDPCSIVKSSLVGY